jgi:hypothetical protein
MGIEHVRSEIEHMRVQVGRQRKEILHLQRAGISTASLNSFLQGCMPRSMTFVLSVSGLRWSRRLRERARARGPELVMAEPLQWYDENPDNSPLDQGAC